MDFSVVLVLPFSALVAFATLIGVAIAGCSRPRLIWPFLVSTLAAVPVFVGPPGAYEFKFWFLAFAGLAIWTAIGTIAGAIIARAVIAIARALRTN